MTKFILSIYKVENGYIVTNSNWNHGDVNRKEWVANEEISLAVVVAQLLEEFKKEELK